MYVRQPEVQRNKIILLDMILMCYVHDIYTGISSFGTLKNVTLCFLGFLLVTCYLEHFYTVLLLLLLKNLSTFPTTDIMCQFVSLELNYMQFN